MNTANILCSRSISLADFDGQLIGLILHKGSSTTSGHWLKLVTYSLSVIMLKSLKLTFTISVTQILFICYFTKAHLMDIFNGHLTGPSGCYLILVQFCFSLDLHIKYTVEVVPLRTYIAWFVVV